MITGHNTDVRHNDVVLHVQSEDKGKSNPFIETLVYVGGRVLAARRVSYAKLLEEGKGEKDIVALMEHQHRRTIAAIRGGKLDEKLAEMNMGSGEVRTTGTVVGDPHGVRTSSEVVMPADMTAVAAPEEEDGDRSLDQVILDYLTSEADQEQLLLTVGGDDQLGLGRPVGLAIQTFSSKSGEAVIGAHIAVKMISTVSEPRTLVSGETDDDGSLHLNFEIPELEQGTAALIIVAESAIGTAEIKHLL
ncbi:MAG: hypothetical protein SX243_24155 [Acidobacteriota bacterium]|nr:hypothetical protein [Acidobacteriota bacterium]